LLKKRFRQAAEGDFPGVLENIRRAEINLAVWNDPLSAASKAYLAGLNLKKLARGREWEDGYYAYAGDLRAASSKKDLAKAATDALKDLPNGEGKDALARDIGKLVEAFAKASRGRNVTGTLLIFKPTAEGGGFWHADQKKRRGIITLKGDRATLWAPDDAPLKQQDEEGIYWGCVNPRKQKFIQEIAPQDFAIFKCLPFPNPLKHATPVPPMSTEYRLALLIGSP